MSAFEPWRPGTYLPPDSARAQDGSRVRIIPNPAVPVPVVRAVPLLAAEVEPWSKPPASVCFPCHPLGLLSLYERARQLLLDTGLTGDLSPEQLKLSEEWIARFAAKLYWPGHSVRARLDAMIEDRAFQLRDEDDRDPFVAQPAHLAAWVVLRAALDWAEEGR
jgi:hypothetical protein